MPLDLNDFIGIGEAKRSEAVKQTIEFNKMAELEALEKEAVTLKDISDKKRNKDAYLHRRRLSGCGSCSGGSRGE